MLRLHQDFKIQDMFLAINIFNVPETLSTTADISIRKVALHWRCSSFKTSALIFNSAVISSQNWLTNRLHLNKFSPLRFNPPSDRHICKSFEELHEECVQCGKGPARQSGWRDDQGVWQHGPHVRKIGPGHQTVHTQGNTVTYCNIVFCILINVWNHKPPLLLIALKC